MFDIALRALRHAEKLTDYAEVRVEKTDGNRLILKNGNPEVIDFIKTLGMCIRIIKEGSLGVAFVNDLKFSNIKAAISSAIKMTHASKKVLKQPIKFSKEKTNRDKYKVKENIKTKDIALEDRLKEIMEIDKSLLDTKLNLPTRYFELLNETKEKYYVNSDGSKIQSTIPRLSFDYMLTLISNGLSEQRRFQYGGVGGWELFRGWNLKEKIINEAKILSKIINARKLPKGRFNIILSPELSGIAAHESCGHPYEADRILGREAAQAGESFITKNMLKTRIGSDVVDLVDDPTLLGSYGFYLYDDEGIKARRRFLIKNGIINTFLHNRETAAVFGIKSNASARADNWASEPIVRMANTFILPRDHKFEELINVRKGVYIKSYMEWNIDDKRFNQRYVGLEAYSIKNGKLGDLVRRPIIEISTPGFYKSIDAVGKDLEFSAASCGKGEPMQPIPVWIGGPHIRLRNILLG